MAKKTIKTKKIKIKLTQSKITKTKQSKPTKQLEIQGQFIGNRRGFGFVAQPGGEDIFIPANNTGGALHGDFVMCRLSPLPDRQDTNETENSDTPRQIGHVRQIVRRGTFVGTFYTDGQQGFVRPLDSKIPYIFPVPPKTRARFGLADGHRIVFSVDKRLDPGIADCFVTEILGHMHDPGVDVLSLVHQFGVPYEFPHEVMTQAATLPDEVQPDEITDRRDLRDIQIFTIDGDDTKDIDDAISFEAHADGFRLGVHIADVAHYVRADSALDREALRRGTSIYLADRVIPMLPHRLSSGICSLFPDVNRLTNSCLMEVDKSGHVFSHEIVPSVIKSCRRFTYNEVQSILDTDDAHEWRALFLQMDNLREILWEKRMERGAIDFNFSETKIRVDADGRPISVEAYPRTHATGIIEECMIMCNETIAAHHLAREIPFVYRGHDKPDAAKLAQLALIAKPLGFSMGRGAGSLQWLLKASEDTPSAYVIAQAALRSLPQARYTPDIPTHFGLASEAYTHFTSPIRRYGDLQVHRIIKSKSPAYFSAILPEVCAQASATERTAEALEREVAQLKKVQFMQGREGQEYNTIVSGITAWGAFVMLENTIEGLVPMEHLKRFGFVFNKDNVRYENKKRRETLAIGDKRRVRLMRVLEDEMRLVFGLVEKD